MTSVAQDEITGINEAAGERWRGLDPLLPDPGDLPESCGPPLTAAGTDGRPADRPSAAPGTYRPTCWPRPTADLGSPGPHRPCADQDAGGEA
jgi:hypothetical protein